MYETIGLIVYAHNAKEALTKRDHIMEQLVCKECQHIFDHWQPAEIGKPQLVSSPWATAQIADLMGYTKSNFMRSLRKIRSMMGLNDEQLYHDRDDFRFSLYTAGQYKGPAVLLYDDDGEGIREPGVLKDVLEKWPSLTEPDVRKELDAAGEPWLVLVSVHY